MHQLEASSSQPRRATLEVVRRAFESAGVEFIDANGGGPALGSAKTSRESEDERATRSFVETFQIRTYSERDALPGAQYSCVQKDEGHSPKVDNEPTRVRAAPHGRIDLNQKVDSAVSDHRKSRQKFR